MAPSKDTNDWDFPHFRTAEQMENLGYYPDRGRVQDKSSTICHPWQEFWSVKFYPYNEPGVDPVFAVVGADRILICRPPPPGKIKIEFLRILLDDEPEACNFTCAWTKNLDTGDPLLCVGGENSKIKVYNVLNGECVKLLSGHGGGINDLAVSPTNPHILASASDDSTIRIWSLEPAHASQPCVAILEGDGHKENVLSICFHTNGRYLLSSGSDHLINLWTLPVLLDAKPGTKRPIRIYYPHFSTSEVHAAVVDCVCFWNDLILSKTSQDDSIVLWSITGFDSSLPLPTPQEAPTIHDPRFDTRSYFFKPSSSANLDNYSSSTKLYTRHLELSIPEPANSSFIIFMRFALFPGTPDHPHPVLAYCNTKSKIYFFDLARLIEYHDVIDSFPTGDERMGDDGDEDVSKQQSEHVPHLRRHPFLQPYQSRSRNAAHNQSQIPLQHRSNRNPSPTPSSTSSHHNNNKNGSNANVGADIDSNPNISNQSNHHPMKGTAQPLPRKIDWSKKRNEWKRKYYMGDQLDCLEPHASETIKMLEFCGRQVAWSPGGEWCAFVGSGGVFGVCGRWAKEQEKEKEGNEAVREVER